MAVASLHPARGGTADIASLSHARPLLIVPNMTMRVLLHRCGTLPGAMTAYCACASVSVYAADLPHHSAQP
jgi:hypothetical protein